MTSSPDFQVRERARLIANVSDESRETLDRVGLLEKLGPQNVLPHDPHLGSGLELGRRRGRALLAELQGQPPEAAADDRPPSPSA